MIVDDSLKISAKKQESIKQHIYNQTKSKKSDRSIIKSVLKKYNVKLIP